MIELGDLDLWSFSACKGYPFMLTCEKLAGTFTPRLRLYARNGALVATTQNATIASLSYPGTNSGSFTLMIDGAGVNDSGTYRLNASGIYEDDLNLCPPLATETNLNLSGYGGVAGNSFVIMTATNLTTSTVLWTPLLTNQFDAFGAFDRTNQLNRSEPARFYRLRTP